MAENDYYLKPIKDPENPDNDLADTLKSLKFYNQATGKDADHRLRSFYGSAGNGYAPDTAGREDSDLHELGHTYQYKPHPPTERGFSVLGIAKNNGQPIHVNYIDLLDTIKYLAGSLPNGSEPQEPGSRTVMTDVESPTESIIDNNKIVKSFIVDQERGRDRAKDRARHKHNRESIIRVAPLDIKEPFDQERDTSSDHQVTTITPTKIHDPSGANLVVPDWLDNRKGLLEKAELQRLRAEGFTPIDIQDIQDRATTGRRLSKEIPIPSTGWADVHAREFIRSPKTHNSDKHMKTIVGAVYHGR